MKECERLEALWNMQADKFNQWNDLGLDEIVEFAQETERNDCIELCKTIAVDIEEINVATDIEYSKRRTNRLHGEIRDDLLIEAVIRECISVMNGNGNG